MKKLMTTIAAAIIIALTTDATAQTGANTKSRTNTEVKQKTESKSKKQDAPKVSASDNKVKVQPNTAPAPVKPVVKPTRKFPMKPLKTGQRSKRPAAK